MFSMNEFVIVILLTIKCPLFNNSYPDWSSALIPTFALSDTNPNSYLNPSGDLPWTDYSVPLLSKILGERKG